MLKFNLFFLLLTFSLVSAVLSVPSPQERDTPKNSSYNAVRIFNGYRATTITARRLASVKAIITNRKTGQLTRIQRCSASVIADDLVLTAAHCFRLKADEQIVDAYVRIGVQLVSNLDLKRFQRKVQSIYSYKFYNQDSAHFGDLAIFVIHEDHALPPNYPMFDLPDQVELVVNDGDTVYAAGYGRIGRKGSGGVKPTTLQEVGLVKWNFQRCKAFRPTRLTDEKSDICAGGPNWDTDSQGTCTGDSGGPLFVKEADGNYKQIGVTSGGLTRCDVAGSKGRYTRLAGFRKHIQQFEEDDTSAWVELYNLDNFE